MDIAQFVIRPAVLADESGIVEAHIRAIRETAAASYSNEQVDAWSEGLGPGSHAASIGEGSFCVAETTDGRIAGFGTFEDETGRLGLLYVHPEFGRQGVGRMLCNHIEREAVKAGFEEIWLDSSMNALPFYRAIGFEEVERSNNIWKGVLFQRVKMRKRL